MALNETRRYFTLEQATRTLPLVRRVVEDIVKRFEELMSFEERAAKAQGVGATESQMEDLRFEAEAVESRLRRLIRELEPIGCQLKDPRTGLIDFPMMHEGREILLCWKLGEPEIAYWHEVEAGFAGRQPVRDLT